MTVIINSPNYNIFNFSRLKKIFFHFKIAFICVSSTQQIIKFGLLIQTESLPSI